jgi:hypothetical protein
LVPIQVEKQEPGLPAARVQIWQQPWNFFHQKRIPFPPFRFTPGWAAVSSRQQFLTDNIASKQIHDWFKAIWITHRTASFCMEG